jgi:hypothetical protein
MRPSPDNHHLAAHAALLLRSYHALTGRRLLDPTLPPAEAARQLYEAPFFVASHDTAEDPVLTYGNRTAQELFEMSWEQFTSTPSRFTAEEPIRAERARLLEQVSTHGFIDDYSGIRISSTGQRFRIDQATVWNLLDDQGGIVGQAATFANWVPV